MSQVGESLVGIVFVPYSARGHVSPMLAVASGLVARGERVRMIAGRRFADAIAATGVVPIVSAVDHDVRVPAGLSVPELVDRVRLRSARRVAWRAAAERCRADLRSEPPSLLVVDPKVRWATALGRRSGVHILPFFTTHVRTRPAGPALVNSLPEWRPRRDRSGGLVRFVGPLVGGMRTADPGVPWQGLTGGPVLVVSPGTVFARHREFFVKIVTQFAETEWTVVLATGHLPPRELGPLPGNVLAFRWIPQYELLEHATVLLTHCGMNSVQEAVTAGVPMVLCPRSVEQRRTARLVQRLGVGEPYDHGFLLRQAERLAADPAVTGRVAAIQGRVAAMPGAIAAADLLIGMRDRVVKC